MLSNEEFQKQMKQILEQAQIFTRYLVTRHESAKVSKKKSKRDFNLQQEEIQIIIQQQQNQNIPTHLQQQPSILKGGSLKSYQLVGLNWLITLFQSKINGILADDMGLGKTIQTISILAFLKQFKKIKGPHLIIAPKITLGNWCNEFEKWLPCARIVKLIATKEQRQEILQKFIVKEKFDVVLTSYEGVRLCLPFLKKIKWKYLIIDQAHKIKNEESQLSQNVRLLTTSHKLLLTGTPLQNNLRQLWSLLNFILPQIFHSPELFDSWFQNEEKNSQQQKEKKNVEMIQNLHKIIRPFMMRRTKKEVQTTLPPKKEIHLYVGLTQLQIKLYKNLLINKSVLQDQKKQYLNLIMQLRKVCNHPYLFPGIQEQGIQDQGQKLINVSGKLRVLDKLLVKLFEERHQVLIFSQMTMVLDILEDYCNYRKFQYCRIDGSTEILNRDQQISQFTHENSSKYIFLLSTRAGGLGINLASADTVIIYDSDWNPQMDLQAMDRAHRIGQKNNVNVYRLITENTVEEKIIERQTIKLKWDSLVIQQGRIASQKNKLLSKEQMKSMLQYGVSAIYKMDDEGNISDQTIEQMLIRGQGRTKQLNKNIEQKIKGEFDNLVNLGMTSISIFDFIQKNKQDIEKMDQLYIKQMNDNLKRRQKMKSPNYNIQNALKNFSSKPMDKQVKKIIVPQYQFFKNRQRYQQILQKIQDNKLLTNQYSTITQGKQISQEQKIEKQELAKTGFSKWTKSQYQTFLHCLQKYGKHSLKQLVQHITTKTQQEVHQYYKTFWQNIDNLSDKQKILSNIKLGQERIENKKLHKQLLKWKINLHVDVTFNSVVYTKFRSKLYSIEADLFLVTNLEKWGNMSKVRQLINQQFKFKYDHYLRGRTESQLNKRMNSLYKFLQKQKEYVQKGRLDKNFNDQNDIQIIESLSCRKKQKKSQ